MKLALRVLSREKAFATFAILTLALGIGAVTTIFSVVDGVVLQPLAYREPGRLYAVTESAPKFAHMMPRLPVNAAHFDGWRKQCRSCESGALLMPATFNLTGGGEPERIEGATCTGVLFDLLGVRPRLGRGFLESEDQPDNNRYIVIANSLWRRRMGADPDAIGKTLLLGGNPHVVVGVLGPDFRFPSGEQIGPLWKFPKRAEIFKPAGLQWAKLRRVGNFNYSALMRLRPGATRHQAESEMTASLAEAAREMQSDLFAHLEPLQERVTGATGKSLWMLLGAVGVLLLIVCVNLGNLMLARASERSRDASIKRALGATRTQLFRPILIESMVIAFTGGALGVMLAYAGVRLLVTQAPVDIPRLDEVTVSGGTLAFALLVSAACGILCGLWPAFRLTGVQPAEALRSRSRSATASGEKLAARDWLAGLQVALSTMLLVVAGLLGVSFLRLVNVERGYRVDRILTAELNLPGNRYKEDEARVVFHRRAMDRLEKLPGAQAAGMISSLPLKTQVWGDMITKEGETRPMVERPLANFRFVGGRYFEAMGIALRTGRLPEERDRPRKVAVFSESAAKAAFPGESAIGKRIRRGWEEKNPEMVEVIGVVSDIRTESLDKEPQPIVYVPYWDGGYWQGNVWSNTTYVMRTSQEAKGAASSLRAAIRELDSELPVSGLLTMEEILENSVGRQRFQSLLAGVFAAAALLLACLGIYGVISYSVTRRTNEIGIRLALGAQARGVAGLILRQGMKPVLGGLLVGITAALAGGRLMSGFLFGVTPGDPATLAGVAVLLLAVGAAACWLPARRAARTDPMTALRYE